MWPKFAVACVLLIQGAIANDCMYTVSVLDVAGVQCVSSAPCSGTYYASGLSQGVGACPTGTSCALLPETPIMGCAASGRADLIYVNADGSLTKDGKSVTLPGASSTTSDSTTTAPTTSSTSSTTSSTTSSSSKNTESSSSTTSSESSNANANSGGSGSTTSDGGSDSNNSTANSSNSTTSASSAASSNSTSSSSSKTHSWTSDSDSASGSITISPGSSSANQQSFNPGSILSDSSNTSKNASDGGLGIGSIIAIVVGCLAVVAIAAGARLLRKGKEAELATPEAAGAMEGYNNGGGGGGMTPKENVLLL
ncbi:hypothetical protein DVH05_022289 [Phytophthora capsici]|nr:hypothetical protein DVH05_022289 [Phytophthora capsici]|eukprot:jgi/Phyca11/528056/estExt2_fgenesh1_pm.C_PHYCAscaffold_260048